MKNQRLLIRTLILSVMTDLYGVADLVVQLKLSRVQFLKRLSLTDLDQDSVEDTHVLHNLGCFITTSSTVNV